MFTVAEILGPSTVVDVIISTLYRHLSLCHAKKSEDYIGKVFGIGCFVVVVVIRKVMVLYRWH